MICDQCSGTRHDRVTAVAVREPRAEGRPLCEGCAAAWDSPGCRFDRARWRPIAILSWESVATAVAGFSRAKGQLVALAIGDGEPAVVDVARLRSALSTLRKRRPIVVLGLAGSARTIGFEWGAPRRRGAYYLAPAVGTLAPRRGVVRAAAEP